MKTGEDLIKTVHSKAFALYAEEAPKVIPRLKDAFRQIPRIPSVINCRKKYSTFRTRTDADCDLLVLLNEDEDMDAEDASRIVDVEIELNYEYFSYSDVLGELLPEDVVPPASFEIVGSIVHLNLDESQMRHKDVIGRVIHDKTGKTVITKVGQISNEYRCFEIDVIGGDANLETVHREGEVLFCIDYKNVYWCSKLQSERFGLLKKLRPGEVLCDLFCGVGPVSLAALKKGCRVYCNDLNPHAIKCLRRSLELNRLPTANISVYNLPADAFLESIAHTHISHFFLNLPEYSLDYLRTISAWEGGFLVHCYFFCRNDRDVASYIHERVGLRVDASLLRTVRKVSPSKNMHVLEISAQELRRGFEQPASD